MATALNVMDNVIHFGLDHWEIYATCLFEKECFDHLDFDNSNTGELEDYVYIKTEAPKYLYKILFQKDNYSVFAYYKGDSSRKILTKDYLVIYGTAFKILTQDEILYFLEGYFTNIRNNRRFDICIDVPYSPKEILKKFKDYQGKGAEFYDASGNIATKYLGEKQAQKNKRHIIRIYNKLLDTIESKKMKLFKDYFQFEKVTRIELEVRPELAKNISYQDLFDVEKLKAIFSNYVGNYTDIFEEFAGNKLSLYKKREILIDSEEYQSLYYKNYKKGIFIGHARGLYELGFCPVRVLIGAGYIQDKTRLALGVERLNDLIAKERELYRDVYIQREKRRDFKNLLDNFPEIGREEK